MVEAVKTGPTQTTPLPSSEDLAYAGLNLGHRPSDGEVTCTGCWDASGDPWQDHSIPVGQTVFWTDPHPEGGECDAYCAAHAIERGQILKARCEAIEEEMAGAR